MIKKQLEKDINYIKNELICKQLNNRYMEFSKLGNFITVINETKDKFFKFWEVKYANQPAEIKNKIFEVLNNKFEDDLISIDEMVQLINQCNWEPEKDYALHLLLNTPYNKKKEEKLKWMNIYVKQNQQ